MTLKGKYNPYHILVSECMLQQTQVERVIPKYKAFLKKYPTLKKLALAKEVEVLTLWQGLGYNRRARNLVRTAVAITNEFHGKFPQDYEELVQLPGIGPYTARALQVFAFNQPVVLIETNIRAVYINSFFKKKEKVSDKSLLPYIERTIDKSNPRKWYSALMDYGAFLKKEVVNPSRQSIHHRKQSTFKGSKRYVRGQIIKHLLRYKHHIQSKNELMKLIDAPSDIFSRAVADLAKEDFIFETKDTLRLQRR